MEISYLLNQMVHKTLSNADMTAIRKARGFTQQETASKSQFETFFLSNIGLKNAMAKLTPDEVACLHLLSRQSGAMDIAFFERLYGSAQKETQYYYGTFTQQYKNTFDQVKQNLLRRGLLVMAEINIGSDSAKMERWRFQFPSEFLPFLPSLVQTPHIFESTGENHLRIVRRSKIFEAAGKHPPHLTGDIHYPCTLTDGDLRIGGQPFQVKLLSEWQMASWQKALKLKTADPKNHSIGPVDALTIALESIPTSAWVKADHLAPIIKIFCFGIQLPPLEEIFKQGWKWGYLARHIENGETYYRLANPMLENDLAKNMTPDQYLSPAPNGEAVLVNFDVIPLADLETLNTLARLDWQPPHFKASPDRIKLGRATAEERSSLLGHWLSEKIPTFHDVFKQVALHWGKTIIHNNLLIACVKDLSLRVQLERQLGRNLVLLSDEYIAFPVVMQEKVEKIVQKANFVIKEVSA